MKTKIQIKSIFGKLLFEFEKENNSVKDTVMEAMNKNANLRYADLSSANLRYANLSSADLSSANLRYADLRYADLRYADLSSANLRYADLRYADLSSANLRYADLSSANLRYADLRYADLRYADLSSANLRYADLRYADLSSADLRYADLIKVYSQNTILPEGELIVWKKIQNNCIAKLLIPKEAKRVNAIGSRKCRFEFAKVIDIRDDKGHSKKSEAGYYNKNLIYTIGELVYPDSFDPSPLVECSNGIHAFITREEAKSY
jgi:uncharacterized protein YjbI with pentapeptide repeats